MLFRLAALTSLLFAPGSYAQDDFNLMRAPDCHDPRVVNEELRRIDDCGPIEPPEPTIKNYSFTPNTSFNVTTRQSYQICVRYEGEDIRLIDDSLDMGREEVSGINRRCVEWETRYRNVTSGYASVRYDGDGRMDKPLIFVQGYDFNVTSGFKANNVAKETDVYRQILNAQKSDSDRNRIASLYNKGYDLVIFRYAKQDSGIGYNAKALKSLIKKVGQSASTINLMGYSMGGVVARQALLELENEGFYHKVDKYIAIDSPFRGVHVPQSVKDFAYRMQRYAGKIKSCSVLFPWSGSKRSWCRDTRSAMRSSPDLFNSFTFKQLSENSAENASMRAGFARLGNMPRQSENYALSYSSSSDLSHVYTGNASDDLKVEVKLHLSGGENVRIRSTSRDKKAGSFLYTFYDISSFVDFTGPGRIFLDAEKVTRDAYKGKHSFITRASSTDNNSFANISAPWGGGTNHAYLYFPYSLLSWL